MPRKESYKSCWLKTKRSEDGGDGEDDNINNRAITKLYRVLLLKEELQVLIYWRVVFTMCQVSKQI